MKRLSILVAFLLTSGPATVSAAEISTHVLDLARGIGGQDIQVVLLNKSSGGAWVEVGRAHTDANGRVRSFGNSARFAVGTYKLTFDMSGYPDPRSAPFFPEINLVFQVSDANAHYHVPVVVSPYGYSTYRGN